MAVTVGVTGNVLTINTCEDASQWLGETPVDVTDFYKEGSQCVGFTVRGVGNNDVTISGNWNLSGKHLRFWLMTVALKELDTEANGGVQVILGDGSNTGYYTVLGGDTYPGGWYNIVLDCDRTPDAGSQPTLTSITTIGVRFKHTTNAKNAQNTWIDMVHCCDGLYAYGDDGGSSFDFDDILSADEDTTNGGWGVIRKIGGIYYLTGKLVFGDSSGTNSCDFTDTNKIIVFENRRVDSGLYGIELVDNGTGTTQFQLGTKSGDRGVSGCVISTESTTQTPKWYFDAKTDTDVDNCKLYGCTFLDSSIFDLPLNASNVESLSCTFEGCGVITPQTSKMEYCNFISAKSDAMTISSTTLNVKYCNFINPTDNAIQITSTGTYQFYDMVFSGTGVSGPYDIENTTAGLVTIQNNGVSNAQYSNETGGGTTEFQSTKTVSVHVEDQSGNAIQGAQVYIQKTTPDVYTGSAAADTTGSTAFIVRESLTADTPATGWIKVRDNSENTEQLYRYSSKDNTAKKFVFNTKIGPTPCTGTGTGTNMEDTNNDLTALNIVEGDTIRNETDKSWATVIKVASADNIYTTQLVGGADNTWTSGDNYSLHNLATTYSSADTIYVPIMNEETDVAGSTSMSYNYSTDVPIRVRIRLSPSGSTRYLPYKTSGTITNTGYETTAVLIEDDIAT